MYVCGWVKMLTSGLPAMAKRPHKTWKRRMLKRKVICDFGGERKTCSGGVCDTMSKSRLCYSLERTHGSFCDDLDIFLCMQLEIELITRRVCHYDYEYGHLIVSPLSTVRRNIITYN